jgi:hypothetical protein
LPQTKKSGVKKNFLKSGPDLLMIILLILISYIYGFHQILDFPPYSTHQWRQGDALSMALSYYHNGMDFFEPRMLYQRSIEGRAVGEFPLIYYLDAAIWQVTGISYRVMRLTNLLLVLLGLFALYKSIRLLTEDKFTAFLIPLFVFTAPVIAFYSCNYLVNVPALAFIYMSWYFFVAYYKKQRFGYLIAAALLAGMAGLLRVTMLIGFAPFIVFFVLEKVGLLRQNVFRHNSILSILLLVFPFIIAFIWYDFAKHYNSVNKSVYFLTTIRPIWILDAQQIGQIWAQIEAKKLDRIYNLWILPIFPLAILSFLATIKKQHVYLIVFTLTVMLGIGAYLLLWYSNLGVHDYYWIELFLLLPPLLYSLAYLLLRLPKSKYNPLWVKIPFVLILLISLVSTTALMRISYFYENSSFTRLFLNKKELESWQWYHWYYEQKFKDFETIKPYLQSKGLQDDDLVAAMNDYTPNVTLSLMDQKGISALYTKKLPLDEKMKYYIGKGAVWFLVTDTTEFNAALFRKFDATKVGEYGHVTIFKLKK